MSSDVNQSQIHQTHERRAQYVQAMGLGPLWVQRAPRVPPSASQAVGAAEQAPASPVDLDSLKTQVAACTACGLCASRKQTVFGQGWPGVQVMVVGEAPGAEEDTQGLPFVGRAGVLLDAMLAPLGLNRHSQEPEQAVYIANVLKCRPPANRNPDPNELAACEPFLRQQLGLVAPRVLLLAGQFAAQTVLQNPASVGDLRGQVHRVSIAGRDVPAVVTYHPAYLLRSPADKAKVWDDLLMLKGCLA